MPGTTYDIEVIAAADPGVVSLFDGGVVYSKGDARDCAYMVRAGRVELRGTGCAIEVMNPGEIFGEMAVLDDQPHSCSAVALGEAELMQIDRQMFRTLVRDDPDFALTILNLVVRQLRSALAELDRRPPGLPIPPGRMPLPRHGTA